MDLCLSACVHVCVCVFRVWFNCAAQVGWSRIQAITELLIQLAAFGPESNQGGHLVTNQGLGCDVTATELGVSWELGGVSAMNHIGLLH